jgi:hypothetical protein
MNKKYILELGEDINNLENCINNILSKYDNIGAKNVDSLLKISDGVRLVSARLEKKYFNDLIKMGVNPYHVFLGGEGIKNETT